MSNFNYPLLLQPISVPKVWGGGKLAEIPGRAVAEQELDVPIGEVWDVSTWPTAPDNPNMVTVTNIVNGPLAGTPLDQITDVPVVVKAIDSGDRLSVQNHPVLPDIHKNEMWYVLQADEDAYLYLDMADDVTGPDFCLALRDEPADEVRVLGMLKCYSGLKPGQHFNVPTGMVHAIGPGLLTFEISEKTQVTYRLYDYNRERSRGKLDIDEGCQAIVTPNPEEPNLSPGLEIEGTASVETITEFPTFCTVKAAGDKITVKSAQHMHLVTATMGACKITGPSDDWNIDLGYTFTCLVPATDQPYTINTQGSGEVLISPLKD